MAPLLWDVSLSNKQVLKMYKTSCSKVAVKNESLGTWLKTFTEVDLETLLNLAKQKLVHSNILFALPTHTFHGISLFNFPLQDELTIFSKFPQNTEPDQHCIVSYVR